ncbi:MAG: aromatic amino acid ammonia-lyase [Janthinobacterium lividum]
MPHLSPTQPLTLATLAALLHSQESIRLSPEAEQRIEAGQALLQQHVQAPASEQTDSSPQLLAALPDANLPPTEQAQRQANLLMAHAAGTGPEIPTPLVRRMLLLKAHSLSQGHQGVALPVVRRLLDFYNREVWPIVYEQGSLGAGGDQIPLAHLALPLLGLGEVSYQGYRLASSDVMELLGWPALALQAHEGPALLSGQHFVLAYATEALERAQHLLRAANVIAALSSDVVGASGAPLPTASHQTGDETGATQMAARLQPLLANSELPAQAWATATAESDLLPFYSLPPVQGASHDALAYVQQVVEAECNVPAGEALAYAKQNVLVQPGNLSKPTVPLAMRQLALAITSLSTLSEQRTTLLVAGKHDLPPHLTAESGGSGLVALPLVAASLVSQNQQLCAASLSVLQARQVVENAEQLLGIELLAAAQALEFRRPARTSPALEAVVAAFRAHVTFVAHDRVLAPDLHRAARFVREFAWE